VVDQGFRVVTAPAAYPVSLFEVKNALRIDDDLTDDDGLLYQYIAQATSEAEEISGRAFVTQTLELSLSAWPGSVIFLPRPPLQSVDHIKYYDTDETLQTFSSDNYVVSIDQEPGTIHLASGSTWPSDLRTHMPIRIQYIAGYGDGPIDVDMPYRYKLAILGLIAIDYENRDMMAAGAQRQRASMIARLRQDWGWR